MKRFDYTRAESFEQASDLVKASGKTSVLAGGTDLLSRLKDDILPEYPERVVDLKHVPNCDGIAVKDGIMTIGAMTKLTAIVESDEIKKELPILQEAAHSVATPLIRNIGTIGGNICQDVRCWFYRYPHEAAGRLVCSRKGGDTCYALKGENRYHSIFGGMKTHATPCTHNCPACTDIPAYMEQLRLGNIVGAAQIIMQVNPMPMLTSRVCAHFCQDECNHTDKGESVAIRNVERYVGDYILDHKELFYQAPTETTGKKVAVVGSGPSGLTAAYYLRKSGNEVTVYDSKEEPGGMMMYAIPAYRLPKDIVRKFTASLSDMGIQFVLNTKIGETIAPAELEKQFDSVYYATGAWKRPVLGLAGEELTVFGLDFLMEVHKWMKGKVGKEVLVTGGGNVAMDVAVTAKRLGAKKVIMACLESEAEMPAGKEEIARAREEGIDIMPSWGLSKVISKDGVVKGMELKRCTSVFDAQHRFSPMYDESDKIIVDAENILMAVGQKVDLSFLDDKYQMQLSNRGLIDVAEDTQMTSRPGIFAGGDATTGPATVVLGIANGHNAARGMNRYLGIAADHGCTVVPTEKTFLSFDLNGIKSKESLKLEEIPVSARNIDIEDEISPVLESILEEAKRCMNCGCYAVNPSDIAPTMVALDATFVTNLRRIKAEEFCCQKLKVSEALKNGEIVEKIEIPLVEGMVMHYDKFRLRDALDFAIASLSSLLAAKDGKFTSARLVFGGVAPVPIHAKEVESFLIGKPITAEVAEQAAELAAAGALPMEFNGYKVVELKALIKTALLRMK